MLTIQFTTSNAAFDGSYTVEVGRILRAIIKEIAENGPAHDRRKIFDLNGNSVGYWVEDGAA